MSAMNKAENMHECVVAAALRLGPILQFHLAWNSQCSSH